MIMIIVLIYFFLSYVIFDQQLKITFRKYSGFPQNKSTPPLENSKSTSPPFLSTLEIFQLLPSLPAAE